MKALGDYIHSLGLKYVHLLPTFFSNFRHSLGMDYILVEELVNALPLNTVAQGHKGIVIYSNIN